MKFSKNIIVAALIFVAALLILPNLIGYNSSGMVTIRESRSGKVDAIITPGFYFDGFSTITHYKQYITIAYSNDETDATISVKPIEIRFNDGSKADASGIVRFELPKDPQSLVQLHIAYRSQESVANQLLMPFTKECLKNSSQLMSSEMHYSSGRSIMSQNFQDQLENGVFILEVDEKLTIDTLTHESKREYNTEIIRDKATKQPLRKKSGLTRYLIGVSDANISDVDYEEMIDKLLAKKIESTTQTSVSKQNLIRAQQEALTKEAEGKKKLVEIEYQEKQNQTRNVIQAQTRVQLAEQNKLEQKIGLEASDFEARKTKTLADAEAYKKRAVMAADGALELKMKTEIEKTRLWSDAFSKYSGALVPQTVIGGNGSGGSYNPMEMMMNMTLIDQINKRK